MNYAIGFQLFIQLLEQLNKLAVILRAAQAEGRDVSDEEVDAFLSSVDDTTKARLQARIDAARNGG